ncbi:MAG TPA: hypothetical protein PK915_11765, partial [Bacteroidales bacterium]|nr:hypothetical protein [Bacteroidales bacterium]
KSGTAPEKHSFGIGMLPVWLLHQIPDGEGKNRLTGIKIFCHKNPAESVLKALAKIHSSGKAPPCQLHRAN